MQPAPTRGACAPTRRFPGSMPAVAAIFALTIIGWMVLERALAFAPASTAASFVDFDIFALVGRLVLERRLPDAYAAATLRALEAQLSLDAVRSMPFAYPPPFALAMAALAPLPTGAAYALFEGLGLAVLLGALRRLSPISFWPMTMAMAPVIVINVVIGQNGMLTAGLAGMATGLAVERRPAAAGALAGLLAALKPQSCAALPLIFAARRDWRACVSMTATAMALVVLSMAVLGPTILQGFLTALSETSGLLAQGRFPLHRMTSVYAFVRSLGASADASIAVHITTGLALLSAVARAAARGDARVGSGLTMMGSCFISPYLYDYDLAIAGLGFAMVLPAMSCAARRRWVVPCLCLLVLAEGFGLLESLALPIRVSMGAPSLLACLAVVLFALTKGAAAPAAEQPAPTVSLAA